MLDTYFYVCVVGSMFWYTLGSVQAAGGEGESRPFLCMLGWVSVKSVRGNHNARVKNVRGAKIGKGESGHRCRPDETGFFVKNEAHRPNSSTYAVVVCAPFFFFWCLEGELSYCIDDKSAGRARYACA